MSVAQEQERLFEAVVASYRRFNDHKLQRDDVIEPHPTGNSARHWMTEAIKGGHNHQPDACVFTHFRKDMGTILDIGAHWGYTALAMRLSGTDCPIISIEASAMHIECLDELRRHDPQYDFLIQALGDRAAQHHLYTPVVNGVHVTGLSNIDGNIFNLHHAQHLASLIETSIPVAESYRVQFAKQSVELRPLDEVLARPFRVPSNRIAAMKIDVEHHEFPVLVGASGVIARDRPFIMIEGANRSPPIAKFLGGMGYLYGDRDGSQIRLNPEISKEINGYWIHPKHRPAYEQAGLLAQ